MRCCSHCGTLLGSQEQVRKLTRKLEHERKAVSLEGVQFHYYQCGECNMANIFVDVCTMEEEPDEVFQQRWDELEATVGHLSGDAVKVVVAPKLAHAWES